MRSAAVPTVVALLLTPVVVHAVLYARAAAAKRRRRAACPFEDDDHETLPPGRAAQLVLAESLLWMWVLLTAPFPPAETDAGNGANTAMPVIALTPRWWPRAALRLLVHRLRRAGLVVVCPRLRGARAPAIDRALRSTWERYGCGRVDVIAPAGAAAEIAAHLAAGGSGTPTVRRLLTLGARPDGERRLPAGTEVIAFYSHDDPWLGSAEAARRPHAFNVALRAVGRLGLLHAPHVEPLVREHLVASGVHGDPSWRSASSS